jgi:hypothetical protein
MRRSRWLALVLSAVVVVSVLALGACVNVGSGPKTTQDQEVPPPPPPPAPPPECVDAAGQTEVTITVGDDAQPTPACVKIKQGKTDVKWVSDPTKVRALLIAFKEETGKNPPEDPACGSVECRLEKAKSATKEGDFYYTVVVVKKNGKAAVVDPQLIILPGP